LIVDVINFEVYFYGSAISKIDPSSVEIFRYGYASPAYSGPENSLPTRESAGLVLEVIATNRGRWFVDVPTPRFKPNSEAFLATKPGPLRAEWGSNMARPSVVETIRFSASQQPSAHKFASLYSQNRIESQIAIIFLVGIEQPPLSRYHTIQNALHNFH
jgi:hypothetical protein